MRSDTFKFEHIKKNKPTISAIKIAVAKVCDIAVDDMDGATPIEEYCMPRRAAMYLCRIWIGDTYKSIGQKFAIECEMTIRASIKWAVANPNYVGPIQRRVAAMLQISEKGADVPCSVCNPSTRLCLCPQCFTAWPKSKSLEEYVGKVA